MLVADGGGYGGTNWSAKDVVAMWQAVENQETTPHWQMLSGWRKSYELTLQHMARVRSYKENLAAAWPPEKSPASKAYQERLDQLIDHLQSTYDAAVANYGAFSAATSALSTTRHELKQIYDQYVANQSKLAEFNASMASRPKPVGKYVAPPPKPPVTDAQLEQLNNKARTLMYGLSSEVIHAGSLLATPKPYTNGELVETDETDVADKHPVPPPIPPIGPLYPDAGSSSVTSHAGTSHSAATTPMPAIHTTTPSHSLSTVGSNPGVVLGGVSTGTAITPPPMSGIVSQPPLPPAPVQGIITPAPLPTPTPLPPTAGSGSLPAGTTPRMRGTIPGTVGGLGAVRPGGAGMTIGAPRGAVPGGVIGGAPGMGAGQPGVGARAVQRVNPVGGVLNPAGGTPTGQPGRSTAQPGRVATQMGQPMSTVGGRSGGRRDGDESAHWDSDNPWETAEGVSPVVVPSSPQRVDPGPAIGLD